MDIATCRAALRFLSVHSEEAANEKYIRFDYDYANPYTRSEWSAYGLVREYAKKASMSIEDYCNAVITNTLNLNSKYETNIT